MHDDGEETVARRRSPAAVATFAILGVNVVVFLLQLLAEKHGNDGMVEDYFALSLDGLKRGYVWQLLTFQFLHGGFLHIALNSIAIYVFGRVVEFTLGWRRMLTLYFLTGIIGGLTQIAGILLLPSLCADAALVGASAGASGLIAAFALLYPEQIIYMLLVFIPLRMRARNFLWLVIALALVGIFYPVLVRAFPVMNVLDGSFANIGHAAHLGGLVSGWLMTRRFIARRVKLPPLVKPPVIQSGNPDYPVTVVNE